MSNQLQLERDIYRRALDLLLEDERGMWTTDVIRNLARKAIETAEQNKQENKNESSGSAE